jgi:ABC-type glutathione transport system ATPase component
VSLGLRQLVVHAGTRRLLGPLDMELASGRCLGVVGESGSGKSLAALSLLGLLPGGLQASGEVTRDDGEVIPLGTRVAPAHAALRGRVLGWVPQDPLASLHPLRTVGAQLRETLRVHGRPDREARELLARVHLPDPDAALVRFPHQFSGGQRQRIAIALALCSGPRYLIADEPTSALDARIAREVLDLLDALRREDGLGLMLISHDLPLVGAYADEVLVLRRGDVVERGATRAVFAAPAQDYTRELIAAEQIPPSPLRAAGPLLQRGQTVASSLSSGESLAGESAAITSKPLAAPSDAAIAFDAAFPSDATISPPCKRGRAAAQQSTGDLPLLRGEGLSMRYPRAAVPALDRVDIELHRGEGLALLGESGSGKSTLGRALLRLLRGAQGRVWLDGADFTAQRGVALRAMRGRIGVVFQDPYASLDPRMRVGDIVSEPLRIHGDGDSASRATKARALLVAVGLDAAMAERWPHQFSGGQRQRIAIARALARDPDLLVCDEAVSALDAHHRRGILELLSSLKRERGLALLFVTHDLSAAAAVAERIAVLESGRIVELGDTADVLGAPQHAHTRALVEARRLLQA